MYIKYIVSLIGTGGLAYLSKGENPRETEPMYNKHSVSLIGTGVMYIVSVSPEFSPFDRYVRPPVHINDTLCLMYIASVSLGFSPFDRYVRPPVPINEAWRTCQRGGGTGTKQKLCTLNTVYHFDRYARPPVPI
jgi:hypothetical protein